MNQRIATTTSPAVVYLGYALGIAIPIFIGFYWPLYWMFPHMTPLTFRPFVLVVALALALLHSGLSVSEAEVKLLKNLAVLCLIWLGTALFAYDVTRALIGWVKILALCVLAMCFSRAMRNAAIARVFGAALVASSLMIAVFIAATYVRFAGWTLPTYGASRQLKNVALSDGIQLNGIAFAALMTFVTGMCTWRKSRWNWVIGAAVLMVCSLLTGSRTPLAVLIVSALALAFVNGIRSRNLFSRYLALAAAAAVLIAAGVFLKAASFKKMSDLTEGRWDIWYVAVHKFVEHPLVGNGFESVNDDLYERMPGFYRLPRKRDDTFPGGYHNEYVGTLAEEGLIGFIPLVTLYGFLIRSSGQLAFRKWATWRNGQWALLGALFLLFRAADELPGLFGYANGLGDFQAYLFLALVVSRLSLEEDCARRVAKRISLDGGILSRNALKLNLRRAVRQPVH